MITRRTFLHRTSAAAAALSFPAVVRCASPNSNLQIVAVGCMGKGLSDIAETGSHPKAKFVAFCDVDTNRFHEVDNIFPGTPHYQDWREMFAKLSGQFDAVTISTPDHWHAPVAMAAMKMRKHVYCQKPLAHTVWEVRQMRRQAEISKVITQMGNQIHSHETYRTGVKLIHGGVIGKIKAVHSWQPNPGNKYSGLSKRPEPSGAEVPASLNWDLWIGPAPMRPYEPNLYHPFKWRDWQDFGGGTMGDFGCHILDPIFTALDLTAPISIRAENTGLNEETWPAAETVSYIFPGTKWTAEKMLPVTWYDGGRMPDRALAQMPEDAKFPGGGSLFIGEGGTMILPHVAQPKLYPVEKFGEFEIEKVAGASHYHAWVDGAIASTKTTDGFHYAAPLAEAALLGNVATRVPGETLMWDAENLRVTNSEAATKLLTKAYREGWKLDAAS
ncbi:MAG: Gfo/Idh/MocA family oxidoreductase [Verrucomicrobiota bacterium]